MENERLGRNQSLINQMPFLYHLLCGKLQSNSSIQQENVADGEDDNEQHEIDEGEALGTPINLGINVPPQNSYASDQSVQDKLTLSEEDVIEYEGGFLNKSPDPFLRRQARVRWCVKTVY